MKTPDNLLKFMTAICTPCPKSSKTPVERSLLLKRNLFIFTILVLLVVTQPILSYIAKVPTSVRLIIFVWKLKLLLLFMVVCRSHIWIFHSVFIIGCSVIPGILLSVENDIVTPYLSLSVIMPVFSFLITEHFTASLVVVGFQMITNLTIFKNILVYALDYSPSEVIVEKLILSNAASIMLAFVLYSIIIDINRKINVDLTYANAAVEDALDQQKMFIFSFSHELRNPLNSLLGNLQLALLDTLPKQTQEMIKTSQICAEILLQLVNNILDVGKSHIGKLEVALAPTAIHQLLERIWAVSGELISRKRLAGHIKVDKKIPATLMLDRHRLSQVMMNLIGNAIKFTESGSISITMKWMDQDEVDDRSFEPKPYDDIGSSMDEGVFEKDENLISVQMKSCDLSRGQVEDYNILCQKIGRFNPDDLRTGTAEAKGVLKLIVRDTGCGMDEVALSKLFQKFSQVSTNIEKRQVGTGLGLYITKEICKQMGGDVRAYSKVGRGSTFVLCLPTTIVNKNT